MTAVLNITAVTRALIGAGLWLASPAVPAFGQALNLGLPIACTLGESCYIQQFFDHDPSEAWGDFTCGSLSYDGHDGTDFAIPTRAAMAAGVAVIASAAGTVKGIRDGVEDFAPKVAGKECGNGVVVDHGGGWETQYCHMRKGSVAVQVGQRVDMGDTLGLVGQSGMAEFPHVHLALRKNGVEIDPFTPNTAPETCTAQQGAANRDDLWLPEVPYAAGGIIGAGFSAQVPEFADLKAGLASAETLPPASPALVMWAYAFGTRAGDALVFDITGPEGRVIAERVQLDKNQALMFRAMGRKMRGDGWPAGAYTGNAKLMRGRDLVDETTIRVTVTP